MGVEKGSLEVQVDADVEVLLNNAGIFFMPMITKGGLETITQHLPMEYAKDGIRVNAVAPGAVYTPLHRDTPQDEMERLSPMGRPSTVKEITDAVLHLTDAATVTGHILYVDRGAHFGRW
jgi:NAD(P)-dependent dehydrogenase (short-subunit alcohol dehydrogenase family)